MKHRMIIRGAHLANFTPVIKFPIKAGALRKGVLLCDTYIPSPHCTYTLLEYSI